MIQVVLVWYRMVCDWLHVHLLGLLGGLGGGLLLGALLAASREGEDEERSEQETGSEHHGILLLQHIVHIGGTTHESHEHEGRQTSVVRAECQQSEGDLRQSDDHTEGVRTPTKLVERKHLHPLL